MKNPKFRVFTGRDSQFYFCLRGGGSEIILASEGYTSKAGCQNGIHSVKENASLNEVHGADIPVREGEQFIAQLQEGLTTDEALAASVRVNTPENARLTFNQRINDRIQDMVDVSFKFYKLLTEAPVFADFFQELMFKRYWHSIQARSGMQAA